MLRFGLAGLLLCSLAACGSERSALGGLLLSSVSGIAQRQADVPPLRQRLTPEVLATIDGAILLIEVPQTGAEAGAQVLSSSRGFVTWTTLNQIHLTFRRGVLVSTRGLGADLMASDPRDVVAALHSGRRSAERVHRYLDGADQVVTRAFVCTYVRQPGQTGRTLTRTFRATLVTETCNSTDTEIENQYWIDAAGTVRKAKQWVGPFVGYVLTEQIND